MWNLLLTNVVLPIAVDAVKKYINSTESKKDDKVLDLVQTGASYLANKSNNTLDNTLADMVKESKMKTLQRVR